MTISRLRIDSVLSDPFGRTGTRILAYLLYTDPADVTDEEILQRVDSRIRTSPDKILDSIHGYSFAEDIRSKIMILSDHMQSVETALGQIDTELLAPFKEKYRETPDRIKTVPGISDRAALIILSEIGNDMSVWSDADQLARWAGLAPGNKSSGKKNRKTRSSNGGHVLVPIPVQCALNAVRADSDGGIYFRTKYQNIKSRRGHKIAIIAVARMMLVAIYNMLSKGEDFKPTDLQKVLVRNKCARKIKKSDLFEYLKEQGIQDAALKQLQNEMETLNQQQLTASEVKPSGKTKKASKSNPQLLKVRHPIANGLCVPISS